MHFRAVAWATVLVVLFSGCSSDSSLQAAVVDTHSKLIAAGFDDAGVHAGRVTGTKLSEDVVTIALLSDEMDAGEATKLGARVVWAEFPLRFDRLAIEFEGRAYERSYAELESSFGPRPPNLDEESVQSALGQWLLPALASTLASIATILLLVALAVAVIVRRNRMKRRQS